MMDEIREVPMFAVFELVYIGCECNSNRVLDFCQAFDAEDEAAQFIEERRRKGDVGLFSVIKVAGRTFPGR